MPFIELNYPEDDASFHYWQSEKGYFFRQSKTKGITSKVKRISEKEYISAYEEYHNLSTTHHLKVMGL